MLGNLEICIFGDGGAIAALQAWLLLLMIEITPDLVYQSCRTYGNNVYLCIYIYVYIGTCRITNNSRILETRQGAAPSADQTHTWVPDSLPSITITIIFVGFYCKARYRNCRQPTKKMVLVVGGTVQGC